MSSAKWAGLKPAPLIFIGLLGSCGYHTAGQAGLLPKTIVTIGVPAFTNSGTRYKLSDWMPEEISKEFIARSRFRVVDPSRADAVLKGSVLLYNSNTALFDQKTALATSVEIHVALQVTLVERTTGKVLFSRPRIDFTDNYEIPLQQGQYFDESDSALQRASKRIAQQVVSAILNDF
jgi:hypothetical protein